MACSRLVGLEKGNCAFLGCFLMSAAGCVHIHARARVRASARSGFPFAGKFRKQNKAFPRCLENKTRSVMFRKLNKGFSVGRVFSVGRSLLSYLKSGKRSRAVRTHARALAPFFLFRSFLIRKNSFFFFILSLYISFFFFFFL